MHSRLLHNRAGRRRSTSDAERWHQADGPFGVRVPYYIGDLQRDPMLESSPPLMVLPCPTAVQSFRAMCLFHSPYESMECKCTSTTTLTLVVSVVSLVSYVLCFRLLHTSSAEAKPKAKKAYKLHYPKPLPRDPRVSAATLKPTLLNPKTLNLTLLSPPW